MRCAPPERGWLSTSQVAAEKINYENDYYDYLHFAFSTAE